MKHTRRLGLGLALLTLAGCGPTDSPEPTTRSDAPVLLGDTFPVFGRGADPTLLVPAYVLLSGPSLIESIPAGIDPASSAARRYTQGRLPALTAQHQRLRRVLEEHGALVVYDFKRLINGFQVLAPRHKLDDLARLRGVTGIEPVGYYERSLISAVPITGAPKVWERTTPAAGEGVTIGIVDSGIDYTHRDFGGTANYDNNDPTKLEPGSFPTAKVVGGYDLAGDSYNPGSSAGNSPKPDPDPLDCVRGESSQISGGHGTHVAGIAAGQGVTASGQSYDGPYEQSLNPADFKVGPGMAPRAKLYALRIFGCSGGTNLLGPALERAADPNLDGNFDDRLDVVNASLGTSYALSVGSESRLVENLTKAGSLFVVASGNDGDTFYTTGSPGTYPQALSVAATADNDFIAMEVSGPASVAGAVPAAEGGFTTRLFDTGIIAGPLVGANPANACAALSNAAALKDKIAFVDRGDCTFVNKFKNAEDAGAVAVVVVDNEDEPAPFAMGGGDPGSTPLPGVMIRKVDGDKIKGALAQGVSITLDPSKKFSGIGSEIFASFSSRGPSVEANLLKPEIAAPGFAIDSARVGSGTEPRRSQGTSMACPMVTGAAALVRQLHPNLSPIEVKALLINTATPLGDLGGNDYAVSLLGSGRVTVDQAVDRNVTAAAAADDGRVAVSFDSVISDVVATQSRDVVVKNHGTDSVSYTLSAATTYPSPGVSISADPAELTLAGGETQTVKLTLTIDPGALPEPAADPVTEPTQFDNPRHFLSEAAGHLMLTDAAGTQNLKLPFYAVVRAANDTSAGPASGCPGDASAPVVIPLDNSGPVKTPVVTAFELGTTHPRGGGLGGDKYDQARDVLAVGAASNVETFEEPDDFAVSFGVVVAGEWTTPAQGQLSSVGIALDIDMDGRVDYRTFVEALTRDGPYADVLAASTYTAAGQPTQSKRYANLVPADAANTQPFNNSVLVLSVGMADIGLSKDSAQFQYAAFTQTLSSFNAGEQTGWVVYDAAHPRVNTAVGGEEGRPLYRNGDPIKAFVDWNALTEEASPSVLLLYHNNVYGKRHEIVDIGQLSTAAPLSVSALAPASATAGGEFEIKLQVKNPGDSARAQVSLSGTLGGATLVEARPSQGSCQTAPSLGCDLGEIAASGQVDISLKARAPSSENAGVATLSVKLSGEGACNASGASGAEASVALAPAVELSPGGGCACRTSGAPKPGSAGFLVLVGLALAGFWRRRASHAR